VDSNTTSVTKGASPRLLPCDTATLSIAEPRSSVDYDRAVVARPLGDHLARGRVISFGPGTIVHARLAQRRKYATISLDLSDPLARCTRQSADHRSPCHGYERLSRRSTAKTSTSSHLRKSLRRVQSTGRQGKRFLSPSLVRRNGAGCPLRGFAGSPGWRHSAVRMAAISTRLPC